MKIFLTNKQTKALRQLRLGKVFELNRSVRPQLLKKGLITTILSSPKGPGFPYLTLTPLGETYADQAIERMKKWGGRRPGAGNPRRKIKSNID